MRMSSDLDFSLRVYSSIQGDFLSRFPFIFTLKGGELTSIPSALIHLEDFVF